MFGFRYKKESAILLDFVCFIFSLLCGVEGLGESGDVVSAELKDLTFDFYWFLGRLFRVTAPVL